jgi:hypothetical protein
MSSNRENVKQERRSKKRERPDYESSKHIEQKLKRVFSKKDRSEKYRRYDANEEDLYT